MLHTRTPPDVKIVETSRPFWGTSDFSADTQSPFLRERQDRFLEKDEGGRMKDERWRTRDSPIAKPDVGWLP
jgi:hypothetical protein